MYKSDNIVKWEKDELSIAESQNIDNTGKLIIHFAVNKLLNIEFVEYYPYVKKVFFTFKEGEILLNIENVDLNNIEVNNPVYIERIVSFKVIRGFLKIMMDTVLSFFKSSRFYAIRSKIDKANGYYSVLRLADYYQIEMDKYYQEKLVSEFCDFFDDEHLLELKKNENMIDIINNNVKYRNIWKEKGFDWGGIIYQRNSLFSGY